jgi:hypothetical protein
MSEVTKDKAFDRAVDLVINQDHVIQQWTGRYITVQAGLATALATVLSWKGVDLGFVTIPLSILISSIAIMLSCKITKIIKREYEWQDIYVKMVKRIEGQDPLLYQNNYEPLPGKNISTRFTQIQRWLIWAWILVVITVIILPLLKPILIFFCQRLIHCP